jgi:hypothetical protein
MDEKGNCTLNRLNELLSITQEREWRFIRLAAKVYVYALSSARSLLDILVYVNCTK